MNLETTGPIAIPVCPVSSRIFAFSTGNSSHPPFGDGSLFSPNRVLCEADAQPVAKNPCLIHWEAGHRLQSVAAFRPTSNFTWSSLDFPQPFQHRKSGSEMVRNGQFALPPKTLPCKGSSVANQEPEKLSISLTPATYTISSGETLPKFPYFMVKFW